MPRLRVTGRAVISDTTSGPIRMVWEAHGAALSLFETRARNDLMRESLRDGGDYWTVAFLFKRFDPDYARQLGYQISGKFQSTKIRAAQRGVIDGDGTTPLVYTGILRQRALQGVSVDVRATSNRQTITIRIPTGHPIAPIVQAVLRSLPAWEIQRVAEVIERSLTSGLQGRMQEQYGGNRPNPPPARERDAAGRYRQGPPTRERAA